MTDIKHPITCHILDTVSGKPAPDIQVTLSVFSHAKTDFVAFATASTNSDGRITNWDGLNSAEDFLQAVSAAASGDSCDVFRARFLDLEEYFEGDTFFPYVDVVFKVAKGKLGNEHYHIPLLLSRYSYSTYRGS
ncbi:hypothetical protein V1514DRAFT_340549 [Lipomyces japonicus]|uniref:uncharacterized protein n=1 Tax=Lipomyces japonicus TaxID=56871 RepID=UPI0034CFD384